MQNYSTQHQLKGHTIRIPFEDFQNEQLINWNISDLNTELFWSFYNFLKLYKELDVRDIPPFCFLNTFYNIELLSKTDDYIEYKLIENKKLNRSMFLRLRHTIFNQYNALIGFSEVLKEVDALDETDHLLLDRINSNAREMFQNSKMLLEYEEFLDIDFELKSRQVDAFAYFSSYFRHHNLNNVRLNYDSTTAKANIDNEAFKTALDKVFSFLQLSFSSLEGEIKTINPEQLEVSFVFNIQDDVDQELAQEIRMFNRFFKDAESPAFMSYRMFHMSYTRLVAEKLHGSFDINLDETKPNKLFVNWTFPFDRGDEEKEKQADDAKLKNDFLEGDREIESVLFSSYPKSMRNEILKKFEDVESAFVLDHWDAFADSLEAIGRASGDYNSSELAKVIQDIRQAVIGFDVISLQRIRNNLKHIRDLE
jgi:hypothetical protein